MREGILIDESTYQIHPYVETVVAFVYDPDRHIPTEDRGASEAGFSQTVSVAGRTVRYVTRVR